MGLQRIGHTHVRSRTHTHTHTHTHTVMAQRGSTTWRLSQEGTFAWVVGKWKEERKPLSVLQDPRSRGPGGVAR